MNTAWWKHARAAFVTFHLVAIGLSALPNAGEGLNRKAWQDPTVRDEFARWAGYLHTDVDALQDKAYVVAKAAADARNAALVPFRPYLHWSGTNQSWKMFVAAHKYPTRMQIQSRREGGEWETVFEEGSDTATWNRAAFATERMRASIFVWGWSTYANRWKSACNAFGRRLFLEDDERVEVRCRMWKARSPTAEEAQQSVVPEGKWIFERVVPR